MLDFKQFQIKKTQSHRLHRDLHCFCKLHLHQPLYKKVMNSLEQLFIEMNLWEAHRRQNFSERPAVSFFPERVSK